jgi:hypothetical protein
VSPALPRPRREVAMRHFTRDRDGEMVLFFVDLAADPTALLRSSPIVGVKRLSAAVFDAEGRGDLCSVVVSTMATDYHTTMPVRLVEHLQAELALVRAVM